MAFGAVLFSLPVALLASLYGFAVEGAAPGQMLGIYAAMGTGILLTFTFVHGLRVDDLD